MNFSDLLLIPLLVGLIFILVGFIMYKWPPININSLYGYRTPSSMKNQERWDFAQNYSSKEMIKSGIYILLCSAIGLFTDLDSNYDTILGMGIMLTFVVILFIKTERAINKKYNSK